jgi:hypothetical protein
MKKTDLVGRNVLLRIVKSYPSARNHVYSGRILDYDGCFVGVDSCVLHFGRPSAEDPTGGLTRSGRALRWVTLQRVEYILEYPADVDPFAPEKLKVTSDGAIEYSALARPDLIPD